MALPILNDQPKYDLVIPSTQQKVKYRPFLVKEEKVLLLAMESNDQNQILNAITDTIGTCVQDEISVAKLTTFDIEYMFLQIRAKSVGEVSKVNVKCSECDEYNEVDIPIDQIQITTSDVKNKIQLTDTVSLELQYPSYSLLMADKDVLGENKAKATFAMIRLCIKSVLTEEERIDMSEEPADKVDEFIESMTSEQFSAIKEYVEGMPKLSHTINFDCSNCSHHNETVLEGMQSFFS